MEEKIDDLDEEVNDIETENQSTEVKSKIKEFKELLNEIKFNIAEKTGEISFVLLYKLVSLADYIIKNGTNISSEFVMAVQNLKTNIKQFGTIVPHIKGKWKEAETGKDKAKIIGVIILVAIICGFLFISSIIPPLIFAILGLYLTGALIQGIRGQGVKSLYWPVAIFMKD